MMFTTRNYSKSNADKANTKATNSSIETDIQFNADDNFSDQPLPRPKRKRRRSRSERGLPPDQELIALAKTYLELQHKLWPEIVKAGLLPEPTSEVLTEMVENFKSRHQTSRADKASAKVFKKYCVKLAGLYTRYSCDNSSANSILDQTVNCLRKAQQEERFVPWEYVFADYSVSGLDASRQGYTSYKTVLDEKGHLIDTTYIDDFTRASRDEIEWWQLAAQSKRLNKRMIGASDGFNLSDPNAEMLIGMYGLVSRFFIKGLREKVKRGMKGGARRGTTLGKPPLGFTRRVLRDGNGKIDYRSNGKPRTEVCIDPETREFRLLMFELFVLRNLSPYKIAQHFNQLKVDGWNNWTESAIKKLLKSPTAIGVFIWNRTFRDYNPETKVTKVCQNPHSEWEVNYNPDLAIVPMELWRDARKKLARMRANSPLTGRKQSRNQVSATTLFSGTLICGSCGAELKLIRSTEKYKQMGCLNGPRHACGCKLSSSKSTAIIESCLLNFLRDNIISEAALEDLIARANEYLKIESEKPQIDVSPLKKESQNLNGKIRKLIRRVENEVSEDLCAVYDQRIKELQKQLQPLQTKIREAERQNRKKDVVPLGREECKNYLTRLQDVLSEEVPMAAESIRSLTGPITIHQEPIPGKKRSRWVAKFTPDLMQLLSKLSNQEVFDSILLDKGEESLNHEVTVLLEKIPKYEKLAPEFLRLAEKGASVQSIASSYGMSWEYANEIMEFAKTGVRPKWKAGKRTGQGGKPNKYLEHVDQVVYMKDVQKIPFTKIAKKLKISPHTVRRAYDHAHCDKIRSEMEKGQVPDRGSYTHLGEEVHKRVREMLKAGATQKSIADETGCSISTVRRAKKKMDAESGSNE